MVLEKKSKFCNLLFTLSRKFLWYIYGFNLWSFFHYLLHTYNGVKRKSNNFYFGINRCAHLISPA